MSARLSLVLSLMLQALSLVSAHAYYDRGDSVIFEGADVVKRQNIGTYPLLVDEEGVQPVDILLNKKSKYYNAKEKSWVGVEIPEKFIGKKLQIWAELKIDKGIASFILLKGDKEVMSFDRDQLLGSENTRNFNYGSIWINSLSTSSLDKNKTYTIAVRLRPVRNSDVRAQAELRRMKIQCLNCAK